MTVITRRTGLTTAAILAAPQGAYYVCPKRAMVGYVKSLAEHLGRTDLRVVSVDDMLPDRWRGQELPVRLDHAVRYRVTPKQWAELQYWQAYTARFEEPKA